MIRSERRASILSGLALLLAAYLCAPLLACLPQIAQADWAGMDRAALIHALAISLASASVATVLIALGGIPLGYLLAQARSRRMAFLGFVVQLPLALPPLASGVMLLFLLGPYSPLGALLGTWLGELTDSFGGIVLAQVFVAAPFMIVAARSGFGALDPGLEEVAATLGHRPWRRFVSVALPLAWPALRAGLLLAWLRAFGEFGATMMVAYHPYSLPIYTYVLFGGQGLPAMLPLLLPTLAIAVGVAFLAAWRAHPAAGAPVPEAPLMQTSLLVPLTPADTAALLPLGLRIADAARENGDTPYLQLRLHQRIGAFSLDLDWQPKKRRLAIVGASGSGKSLTLRAIAGLAAGSGSCEVKLGDWVLSEQITSARELAYVPQDYGLFPHLSVARQLAFPVGAQAAAAHAWLAHLGLAGLEARKPGALSLGQRQRVALARALVRPCRMILLDEPFAALDTPRRRQLRATLRAVQSEIATTTVLVTHDPEDAAVLADEILVLDQGRVLQAGATAELFARPASLQVAALLGIENVGGASWCEDGTLDLGRGARLALAPSQRPAGLMPGETLLYRIGRPALTLADTGAYMLRVLDSQPAARGITLQVEFGDTVLALDAAAAQPVGSLVRVAIAAEQIETWRAA
jgi:ABC-type sulfate/molybdate transport systems ATPase subunit/ABC-type sulfate transport system permease component